jgi:hypothetical protein
MKRSWIALLAIAGCDRVLGLDEVKTDPDATSVFVHGVSRAVINDLNHLPTTFDSPFSATTISKTFAILEDGTSTAAHVDEKNPDPGRFYFNRNDVDAPYRLVVPSTTADPAPIEYQLAANDLELLDRSWGRSSLQQPPAEQTPSPGSLLQYTISGTPMNLSANAAALVESTGLWTETIVATGSASATPPALDWSTAESLYGPVYLLDGSTTIRDRAYYTLHDYVGTPYRFILGYRFDDVVMRNGMTTTATGPYFPLPRDTCVHVDAQLLKAVTDVHDAGLGTAVASWKIEAVPITSMGPELNFVIAEGTAAMQDVQFGSPFAGYGIVLAMEATVPHPILAPGASVPELRYSGSTHWIQPATTSVSGSTCPPTTPVVAVASVPIAPMFDGAAIDSDRALSVDRNRAHELSWSLPIGHPRPELFRAEVFAVSDIAGKTFVGRVVTLVTPNVNLEGNPSIQIDPKYLQVGGTYVIEVIDQIGYPQVANGGDFSMLAAAFSQGYAWSGLLTISP